MKPKVKPNFFLKVVFQRNDFFFRQTYGNIVETQMLFSFFSDYQPLFSNGSFEFKLSLDAKAVPYSQGALPIQFFRINSSGLKHCFNVYDENIWVFSPLKFTFLNLVFYRRHWKLLLWPGTSNETSSYSHDTQSVVELWII